MPTGFDRDYQLSESEWAEVEYLKSSVSRTGYRGVLPYRLRYRYTWQQGGHKFYSPSYGTVAECVWWAHNNRNLSTEKYPEYYWRTPDHVDLSATAYLSIATTKSGYKHVLKSKGSFWNQYKRDYIVTYAGPFDTPQEAAWDYHCKWPEAAKPLLVREVYVQSPIDYEAIEYLKNPAKKHGWDHVWLSTITGRYCGVYRIGGVEFKTRYFPTKEEAAWEFILETKGILVDDCRDKIVFKYTKERAQLLSMLEAT